MLITDILEREEGWRDTPYYDSEGYPTIGYGFKIADKGAPLPNFKLPKKAGNVWLSEIIIELYGKLGPDLESLSEERQAIILSMSYQMGINGCFAFKKMWKAIRAYDFNLAAEEMLDSRWARQTPDRAKRHAQVMRTSDASLY